VPSNYLISAPGDLPPDKLANNMNLWFRLIWLVLTVRLRKPATIFDTTTISLYVLPNDVDFNGHINNGRYLTLADLGRIDYMLRTGSAKIAIAKRAFPVVGDAMAKFRKELKPFERYELQTRLLGWDEKWTFVEHRFVSRGRVAGIVVIRGLFRSAAGIVKPAEFLEGLELQAQSPTLPQWLLDWNQSCEELTTSLREEETASSL